MNNIIHDIKRRTPSCPEGYCYIMTRKIYIPFSKFTIHCIEKDISQLDLIARSVLQIVETGIHDLVCIRSILGISDSIFNEVVTDMAHIDLVFLSAGNIGLTTKGIKALKENTRIVREKIDMRNIYVDLITGELHDGETQCMIPKGRYIPLDPTVVINDGYLGAHFKELKEIHELRRGEYQIGRQAHVTRELEKITGYEEALMYVEKNLHIYISVSSEELRYSFDDDPDEVYLNQFFKQFGREQLIGNAKYFFERVNSEQEPPPFKPDPELLAQTEHVRRIVLSSASDDDKEDAYRQRHYAICDREYVSFLSNSGKLFRFDHILIMCSDINMLLSDTFCSQLKSVSDNIPVLIVSDGGRDVDQKSLVHFFSKEDHGGKLKLLSVPNLAYKLGKQGGGYICFYPGLIVDITKHTAPTEFRVGDRLGMIAFSEEIYDLDKRSVETAVKDMAEICPEITSFIAPPAPKKVPPKSNASRAVGGSQKKAVDVSRLVNAGGVKDSRKPKKAHYNQKKKPPQ